MELDLKDSKLSRHICILNWNGGWVNFVCSLSLFWSFCLFGLFFVLTWVVRGSRLNGWSATEPRIDVSPGGLAVRMGPWAALPSPKKSPPEMHSRKHTWIRLGAVLLPISRSAIWTTLNQGKTDFQGRPSQDIWFPDSRDDLIFRSVWKISFALTSRFRIVVVLSSSPYKSVENRRNAVGSSYWEPSVDFVLLWNPLQ